MIVTIDFMDLLLLSISMLLITPAVIEVLINSIRNRKDKQLIRCKDCKHRPRRIEKNGGNWFDLEFPDNRCPAQDDDGRYNWMPDDNWYCGNAEREEE